MRSLARSLASLAIVAIVVAACGGTGASTPTPAPTATPAPAATPAPTPTPTAAPTPAPSTTPTPAPSATPIAYGPVVVVAGIESCSVTAGTTTTGAGPVYRHRGDTVTCTDTIDDPRVSGAVSYSFDWDAWGTEANGATVGWGTGRLVNDGGAWQGTFTETYSAANGDLLLFWFKGEGGYAGLAYGMWAVLANEDVAWTYPVRGIIYPGSPPAP